VAVATQACDGLAAAHAAGIVHRDIKPANLLLTSTGVVKICDFGIARLHDTAGDITVSDMAPPLGSYKYLAPEQATGAPVDARTDLYALGCTLYAMLAGAAPFAGDPQTVLRQHLTQPPPPLAAGPNGVPPELDVLVQQLLHKEPEQRPADAVEVRNRLSAVAQDLVIAGTPEPQVRLTAVPSVAAPQVTRPPLAEGFRRLLARPRLLAVAGVLLVVMGLLAALAVTRWVPRADDNDAGAVPPVVAVPSGTPAASVVSTSAATPSPTATTSRPVPAVSASSRRPSMAPTPADPIVAMRLSIRREVDAGNLNPAKAGDLYKKVDDIAHAANDGHSADAAKKVQEFRDKLAELRNAGTLTTEGYDRLSADLDRLSDSLSLTEPPGPPKPRT
jgi:serine/threonine-protein kinase